MKTFAHSVQLTKDEIVFPAIFQVTHPSRDCFAYVLVNTDRSVGVEIAGEKIGTKWRPVKRWSEDIDAKYIRRFAVVFDNE